MSFRLTLHPSFEHLRTVMAKIPAMMQGEEGVVLQDGRNLVKKFEIEPGFWINVKRYHKPKGLNKLIYSLYLRKPKGRRAYLYPDCLAKIGIYSPESIAYIEERKMGIIGYTYFVSLQLDYEHRCYEFTELVPGKDDPLIDAFATFAARLHKGRMMHRDFSPGNILWTYRDGKYLFALIDTNQMRFGYVGKRLGCANFARLYGHKPFFRRLATTYANQRNFPVDDCIALVLRYRRRFWTRYARRKPEKVVFELDL